MNQTYWGEEALWRLRAALRYYELAKREDPDSLEYLDMQGRGDLSRKLSLACYARHARIECAQHNTEALA
jgi:hypothetical protein